jgi:hypothetical protein
MPKLVDKETRISIRVDTQVKEFLEVAAGKVYRPLSNYLLFCGMLYAVRELGMRVEEYVPKAKMDFLKSKPIL